MQVSNFSVQPDESIFDAVLMPGLKTSQANTNDESFAYVPSKNEIRVALNVMKNGRAPGEDDISVELLKLGGEVVVQWVLHLATLVWSSERVPEDWLRQLAIPLHKKGLSWDCGNHMA